jgi:hypothetical protein
MAADADEPDRPGGPDPTNLVRLTPVDPPVAPVTAMCSIHAYREDSGRVRYRITTTPDVAADEPESTTWEQGRLSAVLADVRVFLRTVERPAPD